MSRVYLQELEPRTLLSINLIDGTWFMTGTSESNSIVLTFSSRRGIIINIDGLTAGKIKGATSVVIQGLDGNDRIDASGLPTTVSAVIQGGEGDDTISPGFGPDKISGGGGTDTVSYATRRRYVGVTLDDTANDGGRGEGDDVRDDVENVIGGTVADLIDAHGDKINHVLNGQAGNDTIKGGAGNDLLIGDAGDDLLIGGAGADNLQGDTGVDTVDYSGTAHNLVITADGVANDGEDTNNDGVADEGDNVRDSVEIIIGGTGNDQITGGNPSPAFPANPDAPSGANLLIGNGGNDTLNGAGGDDTLVGGSGIDSYSGGAGSDFVSYRDKTVPVNLSLDGVNNDGAAGEIENIPGDVENLESGSGADRLSGNAGDNILDGGLGTDAFSSGGGNDTVSYASHPIGASVNVSLDGIVNDGQAGENDVIPIDIHNVIGGWGNDTITGDASDNLLRGDPLDSATKLAGGADILVGADGNDTLDGGLGIDSISGGAGIDTADYSLRIYRLHLSLDGLANDGHDDPTLPFGVDVKENDNIPDDIEILAGGFKADTLEGDSLPNTLIGNGGDDVLNGGDGVVTDSLIGGAGNDIADYSRRSEPVTLSLDGVNNDGATGSAEDDVFIAIEGLAGGDDADNITGSSASDTLRGGPGNDTIAGLDGDDLIDGGTGTDQIAGGAGTDTADYSSRKVAVSLSLDGQANDGAAGENDNIPDDVENLIGGEASDRLVGNSRANRLIGDPNLGGASLGNDTLIGNDGDDTLDGGAGPDADSYAGGDGNDWVDYSSRFSPLRLSLNGIADDGQFDPLTDATIEADNIPNDVENISGGQKDDLITGNVGNNFLKGNGGNDTLDGGAGADHLSGGTDSNVDPRLERDTVTYASRTVGLTIDLSASPSVVGENDVIDGDVEVIVGGAGDDSIVGNSNSNVLVGGPGDDTLHGQGGADTLDGGIGNDVMDGGANDPNVTSNGDVADYSQRVRGVSVSLDGLANDGEAGEADQVINIEKVFGGSGDDVLIGGAGAESLVGNGGNDSMSGGGGQNTLFGGDGDDTLRGGDQQDTLFGGDGEDLLDGGNGSDKVFGERGNDIIFNAGGGSDTVDGGLDSDLADNDAADTFKDVEDFVGGVAAGLLSARSSAGLVPSTTDVSRLPTRSHFASVRRKLSAAPVVGSAVLDKGGNLVVTGTGDNDNIIIRREGGASIRVTITDRATSAVNTWLFPDNVQNLENVRGVSHITVQGGLGDDVIDLGGIMRSRQARLSAVTHPATLLGGPMRRGNGNDVLIGGLRGDVLDGGSGADTLWGGPGDDQARYSWRSNPVFLSTNGLADDGEAGEHDLIESDVENLIGGGGNDMLDTIKEGAIGNVIKGGAGNDTIRSGDGPDILQGGGGEDDVDCGEDTFRDVLELDNDNNAKDTYHHVHTSGKYPDFLSSDDVDKPAP